MKVVVFIIIYSFLYITGTYFVTFDVQNILNWNSLERFLFLMCYIGLLSPILFVYYICINEKSLNSNYIGAMTDSGAFNEK